MRGRVQPRGLAYAGPRGPHPRSGRGAMNPNASVRFFDTQFQRQIAAQVHELNPFERAALPCLQGHVLDYGCGMGNLAVAAARRGCSVLALDGSHAAITHLRDVAAREALAIVAEQTDLRTHRLAQTFDAVVCIGLLMFFDCPTAGRRLDDLQASVRPGGLAVVNVLTEGTTYMDMFSAEGHCLFGRDELQQRFAGWRILSVQHEVFPAPADTKKAFVTLMARKPEAGPGDG